MTKKSNTKDTIPSVTLEGTEAYFVELWQNFLDRFQHDRQDLLLTATGHSTTALGYYTNIINDIRRHPVPRFELDYNDLVSHAKFDQKSAKLVKLLEDSPDDAILYLTRAVKGQIRSTSPSYVRGNENFLNFKASIKNYEVKREIPEVNVHDVGHMREIEGFVVQREPRRAYTVVAVFVCDNDDETHTTVVRAQNFQLKEPSKCDHCKSKRLYLDYDQSTLIDIQEIKIQQRVDRGDPGKIPKPMRVFVTNPNLIDRIEGGDFCVCTGVIRAMHMGHGSFGKNAITDYYMDASYIERRADEYLLESDAEIEKRVRNFIEPENEDEDFDLIVDSIAPSLYGARAMKKALTYMLVGSDSLKINNKRHRGELQLLWLSSPSGGKTTGAEYVFQIPTRVQWISPLVTDVGLTASVNTDEGTATLEAGAYLLASSDIGGLVIGDEIQNYDYKALRVLSTVMDDRQRINVNKKNITADIQVNCATLHMANPKGAGSSADNFWDRTKNIYENTGLPGWLLARYDLVFISDDSEDLELNREKVNYFNAQFEYAVPEYQIKQMHREPDTMNKATTKRKRFMVNGREIHTDREISAWVSYVRQNFHPNVWKSPSVLKKLRDYFISVLEEAAQMKKVTGMNFKKVTMRDYGALIRLTCASARAHCRSQVLEKDADDAIEIMKESIASSGFNPLLGVETIETPAATDDDDYDEEFPKLPKGDEESPHILKYKEKVIGKQRRAFLHLCEKIALQICQACGGVGHERGNPAKCLGCNGKGTVSLPIGKYSIVDEAISRRVCERIHAEAMWAEMVRRGFLHANTNYAGVSGYYNLTNDGMELVLNRRDKATIEKYEFYEPYGTGESTNISVNKAAKMLEYAQNVSRKILRDNGFDNEG